MTTPTTAHPTTMKAWLYTSTTPTLEANLTLHSSARAPPSPLQPSQVLIRVLTAALNPADYKVPAMPLISTALIRKPASPGLDFAGEVISTGSSADTSTFAAGQIVYGTLDLPTQFGSLGEYLIARETNIHPVPEGVSIDHAATVGVAGMTAWQSIAPFVTADAGERVFINAGSGGCGIFAIQIAKALGCTVTTTCSTKNVEFCRELGADEVIDYTAEDVTGVLKAKGQVFDHVVDHIGLPAELYNECHAFLKPGKVFAQVGATRFPTFATRLLRPGFLGGGKRRYLPIFWKPNKEDLVKVGELIRDGKVKVVLDSVFEYEDAPKAFEKLRSERARGKIVVHVASRA
ncbi:NAD(P)-dependent alcohol dehydrogenase [Aspergillus homomorphus CBS 101889]|uniref:Putative zinc alcohol dehydrogenase n=1 Tax=Aspergillus homomorphus (strain CBS 101889) TaxID=1450537 RepID=A0A395HH68_ASPHC|nr:putative zinc alcohol dehydrogenase [Aspergillus homomorphus CBS 101889]RAL06839.1 putative zinc alcohol dehydrogenase [Aspergillus homomorphus CBS 101889]